jgi:hypothetical protein
LLITADGGGSKALRYVIGVLGPVVGIAALVLTVDAATSVKHSTLERLCLDLIALCLDQPNLLQSLRCRGVGAQRIFAL